jgi:hypothetical protein
MLQFTHMLTKDEIQQLGDLIDTKLDQKLAPINKKLSNLETGQKNLETGQKNLETGLQDVKQSLAHTNTALEALSEGQREIRETMATKADVLDLGVKLNKNYTETKTRLKNLEEHTGTTDPTKN